MTDEIKDSNNESNEEIKNEEVVEENKTEETAEVVEAKEENKEDTTEIKAEVVEEKAPKAEPRVTSEADKALLTKGIVLTAISVGVASLHSILGWCYQGNLPWLITNIIFVIGMVPLFIISLLTFVKYGYKAKDSYIPAFVLTLVALVLSAILFLTYSIDTLNNLIGTIKDLTA